MKQLKCCRCPDVMVRNNKYYCMTMVMKITNSVPLFLAEPYNERVNKNGKCKHNYKEYPNTTTKGE